jgi:hypothetical protein
MNEADEQFLYGMVTQLDATIKQLVLEEKAAAEKLGAERVAELKEFWQNELSENEEISFKATLDYWDKILLRVWARTQRAHHARAEVGRTLMKLTLTNGTKQN